ncbi:MAG: hypothetical protein WCQ67_03490 [Treponema sp.]
MLVVTLSDFTTKIDSYVKAAEKEDVIVEKNGKPAFTFSSKKSNAKKNVKAMKSLFGILPSNTTLDDIKQERISKSV